MEKVLFVTSAVTEYSTKDLEGAGVLRWVDNKLYKWVKNLNAAVAFLVGQPVTYDVTVAAATRFQGVVACADADEESLAGVAMSDCPAASYCWILIRGLAAEALVTNAASGGTAIVIGDSLKVVSGGLAFVYGAAGGNTPKNLPAQAAVAVANASGTALTTAAYGVLLNCSG